MKLVVIESPYAGDVEANVAYAKRCVRDCLDRGESPYASHLFFTQEGILDDTKPEERKLGIEAGFAWGQAADVIAFYLDRGVSKGMRAGYAEAVRRCEQVEFRTLGSLNADAFVARIRELTEGEDAQKVLEL